MNETLLLAAIIGLGTAILYGFVGRTVARRQVSERNRLANTLFATWWYALSVSTIITAGLSVAYYLGKQDLSLHFTATLLNVLVICVALWSLLFYMIFLFTGKNGVVGPLAVAYVLYFFFLVYFLLENQAVGVKTDGWTTELDFARETRGFLFGLVLVLLVFPQILAGLALVGFSLGLQDFERRLRAIIVGVSIVVWFGSAFAGTLLGVVNTVGWQVFSRFVGLAAATAVLLAYRPPRPVRAWIAGRKAKGTTTDPSEELRAGPAGFRSTARSTPTGTAW